MKNFRFSILSCLIIAIAIISSKFIFTQQKFFASDNFGYYLHLPANFIYHDPGLTGDWYKTINEEYELTPTYFQLMQSPNGGIINRFYAGMSILWAPAFFTGHLTAIITGLPADGFSLPYQWALILYGALFSILGFIYLRKILLVFFDDKTTAVTLLLLFFGTNIFFFSTLGNDVPHVYLFTLFAALLFYTIKWHQSPKWGYALGLGISAGLILAVRPSDGLVMIVPALWGIKDIASIKYKFELINSNKFQIMVAAFIAAIFLMPQLIYYRLFAGEFLVSVYNDPGSKLILSDPKFANVLFGFRKGWFIYSPLSILFVAGLVYTWKKQREYFWAVLIYLFTTIYLIACFTSLVSYGWRAFIQSYAILTLPLGSLVFAARKFNRFFKYLMVIALVPFFILNIHQSWQILIGIIDGSRMTKEYYFRILGKNSVSEDDLKLLLVKRSAEIEDTFDLQRQYNISKIYYSDFSSETADTNVLHKPKSDPGMLRLHQGNPFSGGFKKKYSEFTDNYYFYLKAEVWVFAYDDSVIQDLFLVFNVKNDNNENFKYRTVSFASANTSFKKGEWNLLQSVYMTPEVITQNEIVEAYVWYSGDKEAWIDDYKIELLVEK